MWKKADNNNVRKFLGIVYFFNIKNTKILLYIIQKGVKKYLCVKIPHWIIL